MKIREVAIIGLAVLCAAAGPATQGARDAGGEQVLPLKVAEGPEHDPGRVFLVPVECNGEQGQFELACYGISRVSQSFAERCHAQVAPDQTLSARRDSDGQPIFCGTALVWLRLGHARPQRVRVAVMKDQFCQAPEKQGMLGFDAIRSWQWEVDAQRPTLTLRPLGTAPSGEALATLPLRVTSLGYCVKVKVRNVVEEVMLLPGASFVQAGPALQRKWDLNSGNAIEPEVNRFGTVRTVDFHGEDAVELSPRLKETDLRVALLEKDSQSSGTIGSGIGQCVLNRFVYCVDGRRRELRIVARLTDDHGLPLPAPTPQVTTSPAQ